MRIVPQSEKHVVETVRAVRAVLGPGINFVVPFLDRVAHKISVLERQLPTASQDASPPTTSGKGGNFGVYRITEPEKTVYRIRDVDAAIATRWRDRAVRDRQAGLDQVQSNRRS